MNENEEKPAKKDFITTTQLAEIVDSSPSYLSRMVKNGVLTNLGTKGKALFDKDTAITEYYSHHPDRSPDYPTTDEEQDNDPLTKGIKKAEADRRKAAIEWRIAQLKYREAAQQVIPIEDAKQVIASAIVTFKTQLETLPTALALDLTQKNYDEVVKILDKEMKRLLNELQANIKKLS